MTKKTQNSIVNGMQIIHIKKLCASYTEKDILHAELMRDEHLNSNLQGQLVFLGTQNASSDFLMICETDTPPFTIKKCIKH